MKIKDLSDNTIRIEILGCEPGRMLNSCALSGVALWNIKIIDANTINVSAAETDLPVIEAKAAPSMCDVRAIEQKEKNKQRKRMGFVGLIAPLIIILLCLSSLFVWKIEISGNICVTDEQILRSLSKAGMDIGCFWPVTDAETMRGKILLDNPDIEWITINLHASGAEVLVLERDERPKLNTDTSYSDITASYGGIVSSVSVLSGTGLVSKGQVVEQGDVLISGTVSSTYRQTQSLAAKGTIEADTWRSESTVMAPGVRAKISETREKVRYAVRLGKKRINFYINSGNDVDGCDKITKRYIVGVDNLFSLPVSIIKERLICYELSSGEYYDRAGAKDRLTAYLCEKVDGEIISSHFEEDGSVITIDAHCLENIAQQTARENEMPGKDTYDRTGD